MDPRTLIEQLDATWSELTAFGQLELESVIGYELSCLRLTIDIAREEGDAAELKLCLAASRYFVFHFRVLEALGREKRAA
jgi:hypothetical protein